MSGLMKKIYSMIFIILTMFWVLPVDVLADKRLNTNENDVLLSEIHIEESYMLGDNLEIPSATLTFNEETKPAFTIMHFPDGNAFSKRNYFFEQVGQYVLEFRADFGGDIKRVTKNINVYESYYSFIGAGNGSTATYETYGDDGKFGLSVRLSEGNSIRFNKPIDITNFSSADEIVGLFSSPLISEKADVGKIIFNLTDVYDSSINLRILIQKSTETDYWSYVLAGATGQQLSGWEENWQKLHRNNIYGSVVRFSFNGSTGDIPYDGENLSIRFDTSTKEVFAKENAFVIDLDNPEHFTTLFKGFPSNKVYLSVSADAYQNTFAGLTFTNVAGLDLSKEVVDSFEEPSINIDFEGNTITPEAKVGVTYPIFNATAVDEYGNDIEVKKVVYFNYRQLNKHMVNIDENTFTPEKEGEYTIEYTARNVFGVVATRIVNIVARKEQSYPVINIQQNTKYESGYVGKKIPIAPYFSSGGLGKINVTTHISGGDVEIHDDYFIAKTAGDYYVVFVGKDYVGQTTMKTYHVKVEMSTDPVFIDEPNLPRYLMKGYTYIFPELIAYDYNVTPVKEVLSNIKIKVNGKTFAVPSEGIKLDFDVNEIEVIYYVGNTEIINIIPLIDTNTHDETGIDMSKYFISDDYTTIDINENGAYVTLPSHTSSIHFINQLLVEDLEFRFKTDTNNGEIQSIDFFLVDVIDPTIKIKFSFIATARGTLFKVNDGISINMDSSFTNSSVSNEFMFTLANEIVRPVGDKGVQVNETITGEPFYGFPSGLIYLEMLVTAEEENSGLYITNVNGQPITNTKDDSIRPKITLFGDVSGDYEPGDIVKVPKSIAMDVLDTQINFTLTIVDDEGDIITSKDGIFMQDVDPTREYEFEVSSYGTYLVRYTATDSSGNTARRVFNVTIEDKIPPTIRIDGEIAKQIKVGENLHIPKAIITDNVEGDIKSYIYIVNTTGKVTRLLPEYNAITIMAEGKYTVQYIAYDNAGNMSLLSYDIIATRR